MRRFLVPSLLAAALILSACSATARSDQTSTQPLDRTQSPPDAVPTEPATPAGSDDTDLTRVDQQVAVIVEVTPRNLDNPSEQIEFDIVLDTHSVDLSMDLATLASLTTDTGISIQATTWDAPRGGHHVQGILIFPATKDGKSILEGAGKLTLTITNVDAESRVFDWELK